jgi:radical SAM superfamily enzyme YgiQ (UPF0313 family)
MRRLALVGLDWLRPKDPPLSLGLASIVANLRRHAVPHEVHAINVANGLDQDALERVISSDATDICIGAFVWNEPHVQEILRHVGDHQRVVLGGPQVSYAEIGTLESYYPRADVFIRGYAEDALAQYAMGHHVPGIHYRGVRDVGMQASPSLVDLPSPFDVLEENHFHRWETQRGCAYQCSFCQHRDPEHRGVSQFAEERLIFELEQLQGTPDIAMLDPIFNQKLSHATWVLNNIHACRLALQIRPEKLNNRFLEACEHTRADVVLEMGVQTLEPEEMRHIDRIKGADPAKCVDLVKRKLLLAEEFSTRKEISLIYGLPGQTYDSFMRTYEWCRTHTTATICTFPLMLLRGTPIYRLRDRWGMREGTVDHSWRLTANIPHVVATSTMSSEDIVRISETC